jgi:hypothetical protein
MGDFGWGAKEYSEGDTRHIWQQALELTALMADYYKHAGDERFLKETLIPRANDALKARVRMWFCARRTAWAAASNPEPSCTFPAASDRRTTGVRTLMDRAT